jgi:hypothetical protein
MSGSGVQHPLGRRSERHSASAMSQSVLNYLDPVPLKFMSVSYEVNLSGLVRIGGLTV